MEFFQLAGEGINVGGREFICRRRRKESLIRWRLVTGLRADATPRQAPSPTFHQSAHDVQHVRCPAAFLDADFFQRFDSTQLFAVRALR